MIYEPSRSVAVLFNLVLTFLKYFTKAMTKISNMIIPIIIIIPSTGIIIPFIYYNHNFGKSQVVLLRLYALQLNHVRPSSFLIRRTLSRICGKPSQNSSSHSSKSAHWAHVAKPFLTAHFLTVHPRPGIPRLRSSLQP